MELKFSLDKINDAAKTFLSATSSCKVFALHGDMGAGKTTFTHALCKAMEVADTISSPTFSIINQYKTKAGNAVYHIDLYRLKDEQEAISTGVEDHLYSGDVCFVEWPEKAPGIFPDGTLHIYISVADEKTRKIHWQ